MGLHVLQRSPRPRVAAPGAPPLAPALPRGDDPLGGGSILQSILPLAGALGFLLFMIVRPTPVYLAIGVVWVILMVGGGIGMAVHQRRTTRRRLERSRRDHAATLLKVADAAAQTFDAAAADLLRANPPPAALLDLVRDRGRLWERTRADADLLHVRLGEARCRVALGSALGEDETRAATGEDDLESDSVARDQRQRALAATWPVVGLPSLVDLAGVRHWQMTGHEHRARGLARAVVLHATAWRSPGELRTIVGVSPRRVADWSWAAWLPHTRWADAAGDPGLAPVVVGEVAVAAALQAVLATRRPGADGGRANRAHLLVVLDDVGPGREPHGGGEVPAPGQRELDDVVTALARGADAGITVVSVASAARRPEPGGLVTRVDETGGVVPGLDAGVDVGAEEEAVVADSAGVELADAVARAMAPFRLPGSDLGSVDAANDAPHLPALLGADRLDELDPATGWVRRSDPQRLTVPIGTRSDGGVLTLDLKESALGGSGPHGVLVGATGSGKSELLRTLLLGLALRHAPEDLAFVLVDFKGGAAFAPLRPLPHVAGVITNLSSDGALVDRARAALAGELRRRQELLAAEGVDDLRSYDLLRRTRPELPAEPTLLVVIDEFAELVAEHPDVSTLLAGIGRLGRSLGIHLLLASQRMEGTATKGLESHLSYRIALRTFTSSDSTAVINSRAAADLPPTPGAGIVAIEGRLIHFQAAYVSGPVAAADAVTGPEPQRVTVVRATTADPWVEEEVEDAPATARHEGDGGDGDEPAPASVLEELVRRFTDPQRQARRVWVEPLPVEMPLSVMLPDLETGERGLQAAGARGSRQIVVGLVDRPDEQRFEPAVVDLDGREGTLALVGAPRAGKSGALATLLLSGALTHTPDELVFYVVDLGAGRELRRLAALPHVGGVVGREDPERVLATVEHVTALLDDRDGAPAAGAARPADVVLLVDNAADLRALHERTDDLLLDIARRGPGLGVHLVITASRWMDLRAPLRDQVTGRWELRLADPVDSVHGRRAGEGVAEGTPGRGRDGGGRLVHWARPALPSGPSDDEHDVLTSVADAVTERWTGARAPAVRMLPQVLSAAELSSTASEFPGSGVLLGIGGRDLSPVRVDLRDEGPHLLVLGDSRSGRTSVLRHLLAQWGADPATETRLYVVDSRLELLDAVPEDRLAGYAASAPAAREIAEEIAGVLAEREPSRDVDRRALRERSWWSGPHIVLVVDDADLLVQSAGYGEGPLDPLATGSRRGHDLGFHVVVTGRVKGVQRLLRDPVVGGMLVDGGPTLLLSGDPSEGAIVDGLRAEPRVPGRAQLGRPRHEPVVVQTPFVPPPPPDTGASPPVEERDTPRPRPARPTVRSAP